MSEKITGFAISGVGAVGAADAGQLVHFELIAPDGLKQRFLVPYNAMSKVLLGLQAAMQLATEENAKRPGFNQAESGVRVGLKSFQTGIARAPNQEALVVLQLDTKAGFQLSLMLPPDQAHQLGTQVEEAASRAEVAKPSELS